MSLALSQSALNGIAGTSLLDLLQLRAADLIIFRYRQRCERPRVTDGSSEPRHILRTQVVLGYVEVGDGAVGDDVAERVAKQKPTSRERVKRSFDDATSLFRGPPTAVAGPDFDRNSMA